jgi:MFS family permease
VSLRTALARPGIARLGAAGLLSEVGDWMLLIALPVFVLQLTGSPLVTATVFVLELVPTVAIGPLAGVLIDRWDRRRLMTGVAAGQALCLLPLLAVDSVAELWLVYLVVVVQSVLGTVIEPARLAAATELVETEELMAVNGLFGVLSSVARLVGGPLGGLVLGFFGLTGVVLADAATFAAAAFLFLFGRSASQQVGDPAPGEGRSRPPLRLLRDWADGLAVVKRSPVLRRAMRVVACMGAAQGAFVVLFVLFVIRDLGGDEADVGLLRGVQALGGLAGGALLGFVIGRLDARRLTAVSLAAFGVLSLGTWNAPVLTSALGWYVGLFIAVGVPGLGAMTGLMTVLQTEAADAERGRVLSTFFAVYGGLQALGMVAAGLVGTGAGLTIALQVQGGLYLAAAVLALRLATRERSVVGDETRPSSPAAVDSGTRQAG